MQCVNYEINWLLWYFVVRCFGKTTQLHIAWMALSLTCRVLKCKKYDKKKRKMNTQAAGANSVTLITLVCVVYSLKEFLTKFEWYWNCFYYTCTKKIIIIHENSYSIKFLTRNPIGYRIWQKLIQPLRMAGNCCRLRTFNHWSTLFKPFQANQSRVFKHSNGFSGLAMATSYQLLLQRFLEKLAKAKAKESSRHVSVGRLLYCF